MSAHTPTPARYYVRPANLTPRNGNCDCKEPCVEVVRADTNDELLAILGELLPDLNWGTVGRWKAGTPDNERLLAALKAAKGEAS